MTQQMSVALGDWLKNNVITLVCIIGGFVGTVWTLRSEVGELRQKVASVETQVNSVNGTVKDIQNNQNDARLSYKDLVDKTEMNVKDIDAINKHLEAEDRALDGLKATQSTLTTNQELINQQIQFLSTTKSFIGIQGTKK